MYAPLSLYRDEAMIAPIGFALSFRKFRSNLIVATINST